jgi:hypothetical protein
MIDSFARRERYLRNPVDGSAQFECQGVSTARSNEGQ